MDFGRGKTAPAGFTLAPMAWTVFALGVPRRRDLDVVNDRVNDRIIYDENTVSRPWRVIAADAADRNGSCHDYAVTKRAELLALGWPAERLLLCEVACNAAANHLILLAIDDAGAALALDNRRRDIVAWSSAHYRLLRRQTLRKSEYLDKR